MPFKTTMNYNFTNSKHEKNYKLASYLREWDASFYSPKYVVKVHLF